MNKKNTPQSRPSRPSRGRTHGPQRSSRGQRAPARRPTREGAPAASPSTQVTTGLKARIRRCLPVALIPNIVMVLVVIVVALAGLLLTSTTLTALPAAIAQLWLIIHLVPVNGGGVAVGLLPMLPAVGVVVLVARRVRRAVRDRVGIVDLMVLSVGILLLPVLLTLIAAAMLWDAGQVFDVGPPPLLDAVGNTVTVHGIALMAGMGQRLWRALLRRYGLPDWIAQAAVNAWRFLLWVGAAAAVLLLVLLLTGWQRQVELFTPFEGVGALLALIALSLLYLPNALISTVGVLLGSEFNFGEASVSLFSVHLVPLPPLPLLGLIPGSVGDWGVALLVIPAVVAGVLAYRARPTVWQAVGTGVFAGLIMLVLGHLTRGEVGYYGVSGPMSWLTPALTLVWVLGVGLAVAALLRLAEYRLAVPERPVTAQQEQQEQQVVETEEAEETDSADDTEDPRDPGNLEEEEELEEEDNTETGEPGESEEEEGPGEDDAGKDGNRADRD